MKLCSILIPTRNRVDRVHRTLLSIRQTAHIDNVEVLLHVDYDDEATIARLKEFKHYGNVRVVMSVRGLGYGDLNLFHDQCAQAAYGKWVWLLEDGITFSGYGWDQKLARLPLKGLIVHPEFYQLNNSLYREDTNGTSPCVPRQCWRDMGHLVVPYGVDTGTNELLKKGHGWKIHYLRGLTLKHVRDEAELEEHRKL